MVWGTVALIIIFLPGLISAFPKMIVYISEREWFYFFLWLSLGLFFPIMFLGAQLITLGMILIKLDIEQSQQSGLISMLGMESSIESFFQIVLQVFTILNGYSTTIIQKITVISSFFQISRCSILVDIQKRTESTQKELSFSQSIIETLKRLP